MSDKQDTIYYIAAKLRIPEISSDLRLTDTSVSYLRLADMLLSHGLDASQEEEKKKAINGLKCLLLIKDLAKNSKLLIQRNLELLEEADFSLDQIKLIRGNAVSIFEPLKLREKIDQFLSSPATFLST